MDFLKVLFFILPIIYVVKSNKTDADKDTKKSKLEKRSISATSYDDVAYRIPLQESAEYLPVGKFKTPKSRYLMSELSDHNYKQYDFLPTSQVYYKEKQPNPNYQVVLNSGQTDLSNRQPNYSDKQLFEYFSEGPQKKARQVAYDFDDNKSSDFQGYVLDPTPNDGIAQTHNTKSDKPSYKYVLSELVNRIGNFDTLSNREEKNWKQDFETDYLYNNKNAEREPIEQNKLNNYLYYGHPISESKEEFRARLGRHEDFYDYKPNTATLRYASDEKVDMNDFSFLNKMNGRKVETENDDEYLSYFLPKTEEPTVKFNEHAAFYEQPNEVGNHMLHMPSYDKDDIDRTFKFNVKELLRNQYIHLLGNRYPKHMYVPPEHADFKYPYHPNSEEHAIKFMHNDPMMNDLYDYHYMPKMKESEHEMYYTPKHHDFENEYGHDLKVTPYKIKYVSQPQLPNFEYKPEAHMTKQNMQPEHIYSQPDFAKQLTLKYLPELLETLKMNEQDDKRNDNQNNKEIIKETKLRPSVGYDMDEQFGYRPDKAPELKYMQKLKQHPVAYLPSEPTQEEYEYSQGRIMKPKLPEMPKPQYQTADAFKFYNDEIIVGKKMPSSVETVIIPTKPAMPGRMKPEYDENYYNEQFMKNLYEQADSNLFNYVPKTKPYLTLVTPEKELKTTVVPEIIYMNYHKNYSKIMPEQESVQKNIKDSHHDKFAHKTPIPKKEDTTKANIFTPSNSNEALEWFKKNYPNLFSLDAESKPTEKVKMGYQKDSPKQNLLKDSEEDKMRSPHRYGLYKNFNTIEYIRQPSYSNKDENSNADQNIIIIKKPKPQLKDVFEGEQKFMFTNDVLPSSFVQNSNREAYRAQEQKESPKQNSADQSEENNGSSNAEYTRQRFAATKEADNAYKKFKILDDDKAGSFFFSGLNGQEFFVNNANRTVLQQDGANGFMRGKHVNDKPQAPHDYEEEKRVGSRNQVIRQQVMQTETEDSQHESAVQNLENVKSRRRPTNFRGRTKASFQYNTEKSAESETMKQYDDAKFDAEMQLGNNAEKTRNSGAMNKPEVLSHTLRVNKTIDFEDFLDKNFYDQNSSLKRSFRKSKRTAEHGDDKATDYVKSPHRGGNRT